jgi:cell division protein FtsW
MTPRASRPVRKTPALGLPLPPPAPPARRRASAYTAARDEAQRVIYAPPAIPNAPSQPLTRRALALVGAGAEQEPPMDLALLLAVAGLLLIGLVMVYSASQFATPSDPGYYFRHQAVWAVIGGVALLITSRLDYHIWRRLAIPGMALTLALLALVLIHGHTVYGAQRWLSLPFFSFQPSELTKLALAIYVADWLVRKGKGVRTFRGGLIPFAAITGVVLVLILLQNDLGTSLVVGVLAVSMFFAAGASLLQLVPTLGLGALSVVLFTATSTFRRARLDAFLDPLPHGCTSAASYQVCQGLVSLGSGGLFGRGLGDSVQKAGYLPNPFTDSIFAVTGEELGLVGCAVLLTLFGVLAFRGLRAGRRAPDAFGALLACGVTCWLVAQAAINIGSVVDAIPFTGVPLPFVSFGGSSLVTSLAAVGILLNISRYSKRPTTTPTPRPA